MTLWPAVKLDILCAQRSATTEARALNQWLANACHRAPKMLATFFFLNPGNLPALLGILPKAYSDLPTLMFSCSAAH